uniref:cupin domain-containing protein n=1 Tax=Sporosarcina sp. FSL W8-0480 TaxID=2954701 RepID=UPI00403F87D2
MSKENGDFKDSKSTYAFDLSKSRFFTKNDGNYINVLGNEQMKTLGDTFLLDVFLSAENGVEPHYHFNASEVIYCISGETIVSMINPTTKEVKAYRIRPQQAVNIPQGWWHYFTASVDNTHVLTIYDTHKLETVWGSDILRLTPSQEFANAYCLDERQIQQALSPIKGTVIIGPPKDCNEKRNESATNGQTFPPSYPSYHPTYHPARYPYMPYYGR